MLKRYVASSQLCICVGCRRFEFEQFDSGRSYYETRDENEQMLIESHQWFRHNFDLDVTLLMQEQLIEEQAEQQRKEIEEKRRRLEEQNIAEQQAKLAQMAHQGTGMEEQPADNQPTKELEITDDGFTIVEAASTSDAKEYLKENFGIDKRMLVRKNNLLDMAQKCKIKFVGKDF